MTERVTVTQNGAVAEVVLNRPDKRNALDMGMFADLVAAGEAMMLAKKGGLDLAQSYHAIVASSGNSFVHETETQLVLNGSYDIAFTMDLALKDLGFAMQMGKEGGVPLALASMVNQIFVQGKSEYGGDAWSTNSAAWSPTYSARPVTAAKFVVLEQGGEAWSVRSSIGELVE